MTKLLMHAIEKYLGEIRFRFQSTITCKKIWKEFLRKTCHHKLNIKRIYKEHVQDKCPNHCRYGIFAAGLAKVLTQEKKKN